MSIINKVKSFFKKRDLKSTDLRVKGNDNIVAGRDVNFYGNIAEQIDYGKKLLEDNKPDSALEYLDDLRRKLWNKPTTSHIDKYRILANIGGAYFLINKHETAAKYFIEAFQYNKEDEKAISKIAFAYYLLGQKELALNYANESLKLNPINIEANGIKLEIENNNESAETLFNNINEILKNEAQINATIGMIAFNQNDFQNAVKFFKRAINFEKNDSGYKAVLGNLYLQEIINPGIQLKNALIIEEYSKAALTLLNSAIDKIENTELYKYRFDWILHRGTAYNFLQKYDEALKDFKEVLKYKPNDAVVINNLTLLYIEMHQLENAIDLLVKSKNVPNFEHRSILLAELYRLNKNFTKAIEELEKFLKEEKNPKLKFEAKKLLATNLREVGDISASNNIIAELQKEKPDDIITLINFIENLHNAGKDEDAIRHLKNISYTENNNLPELSLLANTLYNYKLFERAIELFEKLSLSETENLDNPINRKLLDCYLKTKEYSKALNLCKGLRKFSIKDKNLLDIEAYIYEKQGDLNKAQQIYEDFIKVNYTLEVEIQLAYLYLRANNIVKLKAFLETDKEYKDLDVDFSIQLAQLYLFGENYVKFLEIIYEARRKFFNEAKIHEAYVYFLLDNKISRLLLKNDIIERNSFVEISKNQERKFFIIEERKDCDLSKNEISLVSSTAKKMLGKKVGDMVNLSSNTISKDEWTVSKVVNKYHFAFQESMDKYNDIFEGKAFQKVVFEPNEDPTKIFEFMTKDSDERNKTLEDIFTLYKKSILPIGLMSELLGYNVFVLLGHLMLDNNLGVICALGSEYETLEGLKSIEEKEKIVIDIISIITLNVIKYKNNYKNKFLISQSTLDELNNIIYKEKPIGKQGYFTVAKDGEKFIRYETTSEQVEKKLKFLDDTKIWIEENCEVVTIKPEYLDKMAKYEDEKNAKLGRSFLDSLIIAMQENAVIFTDDLALRKLAKGEFKVDGIWTQCFLMYLKNIGKIDIETYGSFVINLIMNNYTYTRFDANIILQAVRQSSWLASYEFRKIIEIIFSEPTDQRQVIFIIVEFIYQLWSQVTVSNEKRESLILAILENLSLKTNSILLLNQLNFILEIKFKLIPVSLFQIKSIVNNWKKIKYN